MTTELRVLLSHIPFERALAGATVAGPGAAASGGAVVAVDVIRTKRDRQALTGEQIDWIIDGKSVTLASDLP